MTGTSGDRIDLDHLITADGDVPYAIRRSLRLQLANQGDGLDWQRLELAAAMYVNPIWTERFNNTLPSRVLAQVTSVLMGDSGQAELVPQVLELHTLVEEIPSLINSQDGSGLEPYYAVQAALSAAWAAQGEMPVQEADSEEEMDPDDIDASYYAAAALSGGVSWDRPTGNPQIRREFWRWYLQHIPPSIARNLGK